jgi:CRISPR-associated protein Csb2
LTGQGRFGQPLGGRHEHSHIFPVDLDEDGSIDHIVVYVPMGMSRVVLDGLLGLRVVYGRGGKPWFMMREARETEGRVIARQMDWLCSVAGGSREWVSWTPFVAPRYMKARGKNALEGQVRDELLSRGYGASEDDVEIVDLGLGREHFGGYELSRREGRTRPPMEVGHGIRLRFREPVTGPIAVGYGSHFGLGLFRSVG